MRAESDEQPCPSLSFPHASFYLLPISPQRVLQAGPFGFGHDPCLQGESQDHRRRRHDSGGRRGSEHPRGCFGQRYGFDLDRRAIKRPGSLTRATRYSLRSFARYGGPASRLQGANKLIDRCALDLSLTRATHLTCSLSKARSLHELCSQIDERHSRPGMHKIRSIERPDSASQPACDLLFQGAGMLRDDIIDNGYALLCVSIPQSDVDVEVRIRVATDPARSFSLVPPPFSLTL